ncbi:nitrate ABC transporter permease [Flavobacterium gawalongense]|uniref:Nitrate ABC transporter permease n=1 Tax=Flavobacterium gawalongense TaxID=2594432 RepID=A0A553BI87_9FLAO|nr:nitrate ABC transporter permease [Flavobacterium gawalongense]TRX00206.1 nitrate ABC transporter permease [Flavobacterium gawalongense]TRX04964.1 nitrate ABC transporter permease [Flavobacterium gawalongense]TRX07942.1 nitrate ABC transporter permease [Flavobacterium gawalongense]TRX08643.1 nitrate ABC transporter permease [Flavobacterium gawalongense]TRX24577.1 nitrate ABC transporter permease [Flavobacterium gawalongense]
MSDKNTLIIDKPNTEINVSTEIKKSVIEENYKLKLALNTLLIKSKSLLLAGVGLFVFGGFWSLLSYYTKDALPGPIPTLTVLKEMLSDPFYDYGPNDKGIGLQLFNSIKTVLMGFLLGSLIAIPVGILMGASTICKQLFYPIVQLLKPVSPLAWFPIGLVVFKDTGMATIFIVFITSLWSTLINTSFGVASIPQDHKNVAKAFGFSKMRYLTKILVPYSLPHIITGLRLSISVAWLVIVAGEMLSGGAGIGFFVWDSWNALSLEKVISAIIIIGIVGLLFDRLFTFIENKVAYKA